MRMCSPNVSGAVFCTAGETVKIELIQLIPPGKFWHKFTLRNQRQMEIESTEITASNSSGHFFLLAVGKVLAVYEDDARRFLFPEPKLVPSFSGGDCEVLLTRDPTFPVSCIRTCTGTNSHNLDIAP